MTEQTAGPKLSPREREIVLRGSSAEVAELAEAAYVSADRDSAIAILESAAASRPLEAGIWHNLGVLRSGNEDYVAAIDAYTHAIADGYSDSYVNRGFCFEQVGDVPAARADYVAALSQNPKDVDALVDLGTLDLETGDLENARRHLTAAAEIDPRANWQLADVFIQSGDRERARGLLLDAVSAGEPRAYLELAELAEPDDPSAGEYFQHAIAAGAKNARREYAVFLDLSDDPEGAIAVALEGVRQGDSSCYAPLAVIYESLEQFDLAVQYYRLAISDGESYYQPDLDALLNQRSG